MGAKGILALIALVAAGAVWWSCKCCHESPKLTKEALEHLRPNEWWGLNELKGRQDTSIRPFQIKFSEEMIQDLRNRLKNHRPLTPPLEGVAFEYGFNTGRLDGWVKYWAEEYNFAAREKFLNQFPQFKTNIQGLDIHFIRIKPKVAAGVEVLPLLMVHGWPGSVREFYEVAPLLATKAPGADFAFELIIPSLPGYGFSDAAVRPGLGAPQVAIVMRNLMQRLGLKKYYVQGGDWGALVVSSLATLYPEEVLGHHSNMANDQSGCNFLKTVVGAFFPSLVVEPHLAERMYPLSNVFSFAMEEFGYFHLQATKPDTVGVGLSDSPTGLMAYILEKFSTWTVTGHRNKPDGGLEVGSKWTRDQLIDNLMLYWTSNSITTSMRLYAETMSNVNRGLGLDKIPTPVPTWVLQARYELFFQPSYMLKKKYPNLINATVLDDGGHFVAFELPKVFAEDVFKAVKAFREFDNQKRKETKKSEL